MIVFDKLWTTMKEKGFSTYRLREQCGIDSKTVRRLKANENIETKTLEKSVRHWIAVLKILWSSLKIKNKGDAVASPFSLSIKLSTSWSRL